MQLKIYQKLNQILIGMIIVFLAIIIVIILNFSKLDSTLKIIVVIGFFALTLLAFFGFKTLEINWDRYLIQKMILNGQIGLAEITNTSPLYKIKDSSSKFYRLFQIDVVLKDLELNNIKLTFYEKFNINVRTIPTGNVYITYNPNKPNRLFIIPNGTIARFTNLAPIVSFYEKSKIKIKYLDVIEDNGLVIRTYKESLKQYDTDQKDKEKDSSK